MQKNKDKKVELNSGWEFTLCDSAQAQKLQKKYNIKPGDFYKAKVPGTIHTDLLSNNIIEDPFYSDNERKLYDISNCDWYYKNIFDFDPVGDSKYELVFEGLDTITDIKLNDNVLGNTSNMFCEYRFDITEYLKKTENKLEIIFYSPDLISKKEEEKYGKLSAALNSNRVYLRKAQYSFGWDWGPILTTSGIWKKVHIEKKRRYRIQAVTVNTVDLSKETATLEVIVTLNKKVDEKLLIEANLSKDDKVLNKKNKVGGIKNVFKFSVFSPDLWFPNGEGEQSLYNLEIKLSNEFDNIIDKIDKKVGIRTIELITKTDGMNDFAFKVNGKIVYAKGANWIPADSFLPRVEKNKYYNLLNLMKEANMNIVRVWGGGIYENNEFYEYCDELGIMVWQDFMFACASYPEHTEFLMNIENEIEQNINRLQYHPSIAIWCGNNENEWIWYQGQKKLIAQMPGYKIYNQLIPKILNEIDPLANYWQSSPFGFDDDPNAEESGNRHQWQIWSNWIDYKNVVYDKSLFVTEFGFQAPANVSTFDNCLPAECRNVQNEVYEFHNKQIEGPERIFKFLSSHLPVSTDWNYHNYLAQLNQGLALQTCIEHWRTNRITNGSIIWQINDCWPVTSWSLIDSDIKPKIGYYFVKKIFSSEVIAFNYKDQKLSIINNKNSELMGKLKISFVSPVTGELLENFNYDISLKANSCNEIICADKIRNKENFIIISTIYSSMGDLINRNIFNSKEWKHSQLKPAVIKIYIEGNKVILTSDQPAFFVDLVEPNMIFGDRGFTLLPDEKFEVEYKSNDALIDEGKIKVLSLNGFLEKN